MPDRAMRERATVSGPGVPSVRRQSDRTHSAVRRRRCCTHVAALTWFRSSLRERVSETDDVHSRLECGGIAADVGGKLRVSTRSGHARQSKRRRTRRRGRGERGTVERSASMRVHRSSRQPARGVQQQRLWRRGRQCSPAAPSCSLGRPRGCRACATGGADHGWHATHLCGWMSEWRRCEWSECRRCEEGDEQGDQPAGGHEK